jgi:hypothetical protein
MEEIVERVARTIARKDNPRILDGSENGARLWEHSKTHYYGLAFAALGAIIDNGLGEGEKLGSSTDDDWRIS